MGFTIQDVKSVTDKHYEQFVDKEIDASAAASAITEIASWESELPFVLGLKKLGVDKYSVSENLCLLMLIDDIFWDGLEPLQYQRFSRHPEYNVILEGINGLLRKGALRYETNVEKNADREDRFYITPQALRLLFAGHKGIVSLGEVARFADIIPAGTIPQKKLYFDEAVTEDVKRSFHILMPEAFLSITERLASCGRKAAVSILLYGAPGTGKTELAKQLARETGRDIILADVSKLLSSWHGDTEKNYRELFKSYKYLQSLSNLTPILLLNEADALLGKRGDVMRQAIDKIENRMLNILLQELEDFEGILIATTNLAENLDPAFERRFLYKVKFEQPGAKVREKIWMSLIPELSKMEAAILSDTYPFSGGQIANVAMKRDLDEILFGDTPSFAQMRSYCDKELLKA